MAKKPYVRLHCGISSWHILLCHPTFCVYGSATLLNTYKRKPYALRYAIKMADLLGGLDVKVTE